MEKRELLSEATKPYFLNWLTPISHAPRLHDNRAKKAPGTGRWFLESDKYVHWMENSSRTLLLTGIPGSGKSILASTIIDHLSNTFSGDTTVGLCYLFFDFWRSDEQALVHILSALVKQLAQSQPSWPPSLEELYHHHRLGQTRPSVEEISRILCDVASMYSRVFIVVDAIDECPTLDAGRSKLISELLDLQTKTGANLLATSRILPEIKERFNNDEAIMVDIHACEQDIDLYLDTNMARLWDFVSQDPRLQDEIKAGIKRGADGMFVDYMNLIKPPKLTFPRFLFVKRCFDSLLEKTSPRAIRDALEELAVGSSTCHIPYNYSMQRIQGQSRRQADLGIKILLWTTFARRPLTVSELQHALAVRVGEASLDEDNLPSSDLASPCAGMITVDASTNTVRFSHHTVDEYLRRTISYWFPDAEIHITAVCTTYLSFKTFESGIAPDRETFLDRLAKNPFYVYAAENWGHHARAASQPSGVQAFLDKRLNVEASSQALFSTESANGYRYSHGPRGVSASHLAAYFGLDWGFQSLYDRSHIDIMTDRGQTPLWFAVEQGHEGVVQLLLEKGADVNSKDFRGEIPLSCAAREGHLGVARLLLERGADVRHPTPWSHAAKEGRGAVIQLLLEYGGPDESTDEIGRTPLSFAAEVGHVLIVQELLHHGADVESRDTNGRTPVSFAAKAGHEAVVRLLLRNGGPIESKDDNGRTPLSLAAEEGHKDVVQLLLKNGGLVESTDTYDRNVLSYAAEAGHEAVVRLLLRSGALVESRDSRGRTSLSYAAEEGHIAVIQLLLEHGASVESSDLRERTPLSFAAEAGHGAVIQLLLENGGLVESTDAYGRSVLSYAVEAGHEAVVQLLLENGSLVESTDIHGRAVLSHAAEAGHQGVIQLLLGRGALVGSTDDNGRNPLWYAAEGGHVAALDLLQRAVYEGRTW